MIAVYAEFGFNLADMKPEMFTTPDNVIRIGHEPVRLEILTNISGVTFAEAYAHHVKAAVNDLIVPFISLADLIKNKTSTGRGKDLVDAEALQKRQKK